MRTPWPSQSSTLQLIDPTSASAAIPDVPQVSSAPMRIYFAGPPRADGDWRWKWLSKKIHADEAYTDEGTSFVPHDSPVVARMVKHDGYWLPHAQAAMHWAHLTVVHIDHRRDPEDEQADLLFEAAYASRTDRMLMFIATRQVISRARWLMSFKVDSVKWIVVELKNRSEPPVKFDIIEAYAERVRQRLLGL